MRETPVFPNARRLKYFTFTRLAMGWVRLNWIVKELEFQMVTTGISTTIPAPFTKSTYYDNECYTLLL